MNHTYVKGLVAFSLIFLGNELMNKALTPKIETSKYHYALSASQLDLKKGAIYTLSCTGDDANKISWLSSNTQIATISKSGQIIAKKAGQTIISAKVAKEYKDIIVNVYNTAKSDILIYNDTQVTAAKSEVKDKISISKFKLTLSSNTYTYDGKAKKPKVQVEADNNKILTKNKDYKVRYEHNKKAGTAKVVVTGINDYTGTLVGSFKIEKSATDEATSVASSTDPVVNTTNDTIVTTPATSYTYNYSTIAQLTPTTKPTTTKKATTSSTSSSTKKKKTVTTTTTPKKNTNNASTKKTTTSNASSRSETAGSSSNGTSSTSSSNTSSNSSNSSTSNSNAPTDSNTTANSSSSSNSTSNSSSNTTTNSESNTTTNNTTNSSSSSSTPTTSEETDSVVA